MRRSFTCGIVIGGIVGAVISMLANDDIDINRTKKRMMRMGRNVCKKSRRWISDFNAMVH